MTLRWSDVAAADLDDIYDYVARDVPYYAELFVDRLVAATDKLEDHPRIGRRVPEAGHRDDVREISVFPTRDGKSAAARGASSVRVSPHLGRSLAQLRRRSALDDRGQSRVEHFLVGSVFEQLFKMGRALRIELRCRVFPQQRPLTFDSTFGPLLLLRSLGMRRIMYHSAVEFVQFVNQIRR